MNIRDIAEKAANQIDTTYERGMEASKNATNSEIVNGREARKREHERIIQIIEAAIAEAISDPAKCTLILDSSRSGPVMDALAERSRQDAKWGEQNHDPITWSAILTEECGEFAEAALHCRFGGPAADNLRDEAVQVAAVALQIVECIDRNS